MDYSEFRAMNSAIVMAAEGEANTLAHGFAQARSFIEAGETRFTRFSETSELAKLNRSSGTWFQASPEMFDVVTQARDFAEETEGLFDPMILDVLESAGYDKSMDEIRAHGVSTSTRSAIPARSDFREIQLDLAARSIRLPIGSRIDLGGIAKGWIAEQAALRLSEYAEACVVNAGGDLFAIGSPSDQPSWPIGLEDPRAEAQTLAVLGVQSGAVATSSIMKRRWQQGDRIQHHLIDPRVGQPANTDWLSVTVAAPHAVLAEVFAKVLLIVGSSDAVRLSERRPEIGFIAIDAAGQLWGSVQSREMLNVHSEYA
jgi:thiamine biosynthesis lipoprotein